MDNRNTIPETDKYILLSYVTGLSYRDVRNGILLNSFVLPDSLKADYDRLLLRREAGEPVQYITGAADFYGREFLCEEGVLIPRADTETVVEAALVFLKGSEKVLDLCCGTGCIGITLCLEKSIEATLADISQKALALVVKNAERFGVFAETHIIRHDAFKDALADKYDMIVCNPPYIRSGDIESLQPEVRREPVLALDGGEDGLAFYRTISERYKTSLVPGGTLIFECGYDQADEIVKILSSNGFRNIKKHRDYNNTERAVSAILP